MRVHTPRMFPQIQTISLLALLTSCAPHGAFRSQSFLTESLRGKSWSTPVEIEPRPAIPSTSDPRTFQSFDAGSDGEGLSIVASLFESGSGTFEASALSVNSWAEVVATGSASFQFQGFANGAGLVRLVENLNGSSLIAVMGDEVSTTEVHVALLQNGRWGGVDSSPPVLDMPLPSNSASSIQFLRSPIAGTFDSVGRAHLLWGGNPLHLSLWDGAGFDSNEDDSSANALTSSGAPTQDSRFLSTLNDWTCAFHRDSPSGETPGLYSTCFGGSKDDINTALLLEGIDEFDAASDADGNFLIVARGAEVNTPVSFWMGVDEFGDLVADNEAIALMETLPEGAFEFPKGSPDEPVDGRLIPGFRVAALGEGYFLAVWVAIDGSATSGTARLYSSIYDVYLGTWTNPEWLGQFESSYSKHITLSGLQLKGNEMGDAILAVSFVSLEGNTVAEDIRTTLVSRFHINEGWMPLQQMGDGCGRFEIAGVNPTRECTHAPAVALTRSGDSLVVFPDQDENGIFRVKASVFSR